MSRTHTVEPGSAILTGTLFPEPPYRSAEIAFSFDVKVLSFRLSHGVMLEFGNTSRGLAIWVEQNQRIGMACGWCPTPTPLNNQQYTLDFTDDLALPLNKRAHIVATARGGDGTIRLWVNGQLVLRSRANAGFFGNHWWTQAAQGSYFYEPAPPSGVFKAARVQHGPEGILPLSPLSMFRCQRVRHYDSGPQDTGFESKLDVDSYPIPQP